MMEATRKHTESGTGYYLILKTNIPNPESHHHFRMKVFKSNC